MDELNFQHLWKKVSKIPTYPHRVTLPEGLIYD